MPWETEGGSWVRARSSSTSWWFRLNIVIPRNLGVHDQEQEEQEQGEQEEEEQEE